MKFLKKTGNRGEIAKLQEERRQVREQMEAYEIQQEKLWKAQQELLEKRLKEQEEKLREANVRLAGYEELPMKEQELDRAARADFPVSGCSGTGADSKAAIYAGPEAGRETKSGIGRGS